MLKLLIANVEFTAGSIRWILFPAQMKPFNNISDHSLLNRFQYSFLLLCLLLNLSCGHAAQFYISLAGSDSGDGSLQNPFTSLADACKKIQQDITGKKISATQTIRITVSDGNYYLAAPVIFDSKHLPWPNPTIIEASSGAHPVFNGGVQINSWRKSDKEIPQLQASAQGKIWIADVPKVDGRVLEFRQMWVNGHKAVRAREPNATNLYRLIAWSKTNQTATIPANALAGIRNPEQLEMIIDQVWEIADLRVSTIHIDGSNALITFKQPESKIEFQHPWPLVIVKSNYAAPFFLANSIELLDAPGEWFEDVANQKIYYWPREGEDLTTAKVIAPVLETLVDISGTPDKPIANVQFKGITFAYTTWLRPSYQGHVPLQAGMFMLDAYKLSPRGTSYQPKLDNVAWVGRPPAAVVVKNAHHISFESCIFTHTASAGLDFETRTHDDTVEGCIFHDIGGNGIQVGRFSNPDVETHTPWNPSDEQEICSREKISNNVIYDCGAEDWGCVGICAGYVRSIQISHNEIFNLPYSGISIGWGWTKLTNALRDNFISANRIHHVGQKLGDLGGIYTLSAQPGTVIAENVVSDMQPGPYVPDPQHWFYLYADEGSSFEVFRDNWCPAEKFLRNANGPGNVWTNNGPQVSDAIKNAAGLENRFRSLQSDVDIGR